MKQLVLWKPILCKNFKGIEVSVNVIGELDVRYCGTLLNRIIKMPQKKPITLKDGFHLLHQELDRTFDAKIFHDQPGGYQWYETHFVEWLSEIGYHIELTGDEFEPLVLSSKIS